jgi:hypothetical protein
MHQTNDRLMNGYALNCRESRGDGSSSMLRRRGLRERWKQRRRPKVVGSPRAELASVTPFPAAWDLGSIPASLGLPVVTGVPGGLVDEVAAAVDAIGYKTFYFGWALSSRVLLAWHSSWYAFP